MSSTRSDATEAADFAAFMKQREQAAAAYVCGDPSPLDAMTRNDGGGTFFHPGGAVVVGAVEVRARYERDAASFEPVGRPTSRCSSRERAATWPSGQVCKLPRYGCEGVMLSCR